MPSVLKAAAEHRKALGGQQALAAETTARAYAEAWETIRVDMRLLQDRIDQARRTGDTVDEARLGRQTRYRQLLLQVERQLTGLAPLVASTTDTLIQAALAAAATDTALTSSWARSPSAGSTLLPRRRWSAPLNVVPSPTSSSRRSRLRRSDEEHPPHRCRPGLEPDEDSAGAPPCRRRPARHRRQGHRPHRADAGLPGSDPARVPRQPGGGEVDLVVPTEQARR